MSSDLKILILRASLTLISYHSHGRNNDVLYLVVGVVNFAEFVTRVADIER
jgi:hypothetical protein